MNKFVKYGLIAVGTLVGLFILLLVAIAVFVDPNDYKPLVVDLVKEKKQRTLTLDGDVELALFPKLGLKMGKASLSEHQGTDEFASIDRIQLSVAWLPLLRNQLVVDHVAVEGLKAHLIRFADGTTNFDDLLKKEEEDKQQIQFDIDGVKVMDSYIRFDDRLAQRVVTLQSLQLKTGRLKDATPTDISAEFQLAVDKPAVDTQVNLKTGLMFDLEKKHYAVDGLDLRAKGQAVGLADLELSLSGSASAQPGTRDVRAEGVKLAVSAKRNGEPFKLDVDAPQLVLTSDKVTGDNIKLSAEMERPDGRVVAKLDIPGVEGTGQAFQTQRLTLDVEGRQGKSQFQGKLASPVHGNLERLAFSLPKIEGSVALTNPDFPNGGAKLSLGGQAQAEIQAERVSADLSARFDESAIRAKLGMQGFAAPRYTFDVGIDKIDVDRYIGTSKKADAKAEKGPEKPFDLSALRNLNATGTLRIGTLKVRNIKSSNVRIDIKAANGQVSANPFSASLYKGSMNGSVSVRAVQPPQFAVRQTLTGVDIHPLLMDLAEKDILEGRGNVVVDLTTQGQTVTALKKALGGRASVRLEDGAIKGIDIAGTIRNAKSRLGTLKGETTQQASAAQKTDFTELTATFQVRDGIAHNNDLSAKSPLLRLGGEGAVNIPGSSLDYLAKATVVGTLKGQGGREISDLRGVTVPVRISGPFDALKYRLDFDALVTESVKGKVEQKLEEKKEEAKGKLEEKLQERLKGLFGR